MGRLAGWQSAAFDLTSYAGEAIKFKFKRTGGTIGIDNVRPVVALPGYATSGTVGWEVGADNQVYATVSSGAALVSAPFTMTAESQYTLVRLTGLGAASDQVQLYVLSGAAYTMSTQVAATSISDGWGDLRLMLSAWQGQAIRLKMACSYGKIGVDDVARQIIELPGWTVSGDSRRMEDGQGGVYASTDSVLVSSPFTLATGLQQLTVRHRLESGSGQRFYISLLRGSGFGEEVGPIAGVPVTTTMWQTATIDVGAYAGETVRLKLRTYFNRVQFDDAGFGERLLPGWQTVNAGFGAIAAGKDAAGPYLTTSTAGGAFTVQSAPFSPGLSGGGGDVRYYAVAYDIGYGVGSLVRIWWVDQATQQAYIVFQDGADTPTGYRLRYFGLPGALGATGVLQVHVTGGGKLYSVGLNAVRRHASEPYALDAGDGVDTVTGAFTTNQEDVRIDGALPIPFVRTYHSQLDQAGALGRNWSHLYAAHLEFSQFGDVSVVLGSGQEHFFRSHLDGTFTPDDSRVQAAFGRTPDNSYIYTATTGLRYGFDAGGRLLALTDANGSVLTLSYTGELLSTVSGDAGGLTLGYDAANRLVALSASTGVTVTYQYDGDELAGVVRSDGHTTQYAHDARHHLTTVVENGATVTSNSYDDVGRVLTQGTAGGPLLSFAYASPAQGVTAVTNAQGAVTRYYHDSFGRTTHVLTPDGQLTTYLYDAAGNLLEVQHTGNQPPAVNVNATPATGTAPLAVSFTAVGADPDGDTLSYSWDFGDGGGAGNATEASHVYAQGGLYTATVTVSDGLATASAQAGIAVNHPPVVSLSATPASGAAPLDVTLTAQASDADGDALSYSWDFGDGVIAGGAASVLHRYEASGVYTATVTVSDGKTTVGAAQRIVVTGAAGVLAPDPIDPSTATTLFGSTAFLYSGANPVQTGVVSGTIEPGRASVIRGRILQPDGAGLAGAQVTVRDHPELGTTGSRADGGYDLAVNGGGALTLDVSKPGYLPAQRTVEVPWQQFVVVEAIVLTSLDAAVSTIDLSAATPIQVARGSVVSDTDGARQATLLMPQGVTATMVLPGGALQSLSTLHVRATEYTVGDSGPQAMPGELPAQSGYTYAVELSVDEALAAGASEVRFDRPVYYYVENFLGFGVGMNVPAGYYDRSRSGWMPAPDGRVVQIVGVADGLAQIDSSGDGAPDDDPLLGFTAAERQTLAALYPVGQTLWRVPIMHFTPWDFNWPFRLPDDAVAPPAGPLGQDRPVDAACTVSGSILECENQTLGERTPLAGTPYTLNYRSDRVEGRDLASLTVPLSEASVPASLARIDLRVRVAGKEFVQSFAPQPNLAYTYTWDGVDAYDRTLQGSAAAEVEVAYVYAGVYTAPAARMVMTQPFGVGGPPTATASFGFSAPAVVAVNANGPIATRDELRVERTWETTVARRDLRGEGLGGWSVDAHHSYDPVGRTLLLGDGTRRTLETSFATVAALTTNATDTICPAEGTPGADACLEAPGALAAAPDGSVYVGDGCSIRRVAADGTISRIAGLRDVCAFDGDGGAALDAQLSWPHALAVAPNGDLYVLDGLGGSGRRVRRIVPSGAISTVAGNGLFGFNGDGMAATQASFTNPNALAVDVTGVLYIADTGANRVRRVGLNGEITTVAGTGQTAYNGDGLAATATTLYAPYDLAVGADGSLYIADTLHHRVRRVRPDGIVETVAGNGGGEYSGDGLPGVQTALPVPWRLEIDAAGQLLIASGGWSWYGAVRLVTLPADGVLATVAGGEDMLVSGDIVGMPAAAVDLFQMKDVAAAPDGGFVLTFYADARLFGVKQTLPAFDGEEIRLPSTDGREVYEFDATGRHLRTRDALTGAVRLSFTYDAAGRLASMVDGDGAVTSFLRNAAGGLAAIAGPEGQQTTVTLDANGYVAALTDPAGATQRFTTSDKGLITAATDARDNASVYSYADNGRVVSNQNGIGGGHGFSIEAMGASRVVTVTNALGAPTRYTVTEAATGTQVRSATTADGATTTLIAQADGTTVKIDARGMRTTTVLGPDPRWGMNAPLVTRMTQTTAEGLVLMTREMTRTVTLTDPTDPFSLVALTDTVTTNGRTSTTVYDAVARTQTVTDPAGKVTVTTFDGQGRPLTVSTSGLAPVSYGYDARGRLTTTVEGEGTNLRTTVLSYDALGRLSSRSDALGAVTTYGYDAAGRRIAETLPTGQTLNYAYDAMGNLTAQQDVRGSVTTYEYDAANRRVAQVVDAGGLAVRSEYTFDAAGNLTAQIEDAGAGRLNLTTHYTYTLVSGRYRSSEVMDAAGNVKHYTYNTAGELVSETDALQQTTTYTSGYSATGRWAQVTTPGGRTTTTASNTEGQPLRITDAAGGVTLYAYDALGRLHTTTTGAAPIGGQPALNRTITTTYDVHGRIVGVTDALGNTATRSYDAFGRLASESDALGNTTLYSYDALDRLVRVTTGANVPGEALSTAYTYDAAGRKLTMHVDPDGLNLTTQYHYTRPGSSDTWSLQEVVDAKGNVTAYSYNSLGQLAATTDAQGQTWSFTYDNLGRQVTQSDPLGRTTTTTVDALGRRTSLTLDGRSEQWAYRPDGALAGYLDFAGRVTSFGYTPDGELSAIDYPEGTADVSYVYDAAGNVTSMSDGLGVTSYSYNVLNQMASRSRNGRTVSYAYTLSGQVGQVGYWNRGSVQVGYDAAGRLTGLAPWGAAATSYTYRSTGLLASETRPNSVNTAYSYDTASRLTGVNGIGYILDANGNRTQMSDWEGVTTYSYDALDRLAQATYPTSTVTYTLDSVGNRLSDSASNLILFIAATLGDVTSGSWSMFFDGADMALDTATSEDIDGFWVNPASEALYLSSYDFSTIGVGAAGDKHDLSVCAPGSLGEDTTCTPGFF